MIEHGRITAQGTHAARGSARRMESVNNHKGGGPPGQRALTCRAQAMSLRSMPLSDAAPVSIADRLDLVRTRIAAAAARAGRSPDAITLIAVSKTHPAEQVLAALAAGQQRFGENRVQEAESKFPPLRAAHPHLQLHLIGGLQSNKAAAAVGLADMIESLDRPKLLDALATAMDQQQRRPTILVQVNTGDEPQKSGIPRAAADDFIAQCRDRLGAALQGLMCVPPADADPSPHFAWLADRAAHHRLPILSMGMSGDYEAAIAQGATQIRVGSAIFGQR